MPGSDRASGARQRMAYEAARIMVEQRLADYDRARRKAAERTGILDRRSWPSNEAIQEALITQQRLFKATDQAQGLERLRGVAIEAMRAFHGFSPRLIGPVLDRAGPVEPGIQLFLFSERPEEVVFRLLEQQIPWQERERSFRYGGGERRSHPVFRFFAGETPVELIVLPRSALRNPPLDPVTERPARGASREDLERLLAASADQDLSWL
ncbi:MAG: hypothetical protein ACM3ST_04610 [Bdellovibrio bacteriovorus]